MISFDYAANQIGGVWRLAFSQFQQDGDKRADTDLDYSVDGFFKSFWAIPFSAPFAILGFIAARRFIERFDSDALTAIQGAPMATMIGVNSLAFLADWALSVSAIIAVAKALNATNAVSNTIVGYNWATMVITAINALVLVLISFLGKAASALAIPAMAVTLALLWGVFRRLMNTTPGTTIAIIIILTLISFIVSAGFGAAATSLLQPTS
ncbi:MAG: hypothetical protein AAGJ73_03705 [Pseudomonadota bacterium]